MKIKFRTVFWVGAAVVLLALLVFAFRPQPVPVDVAEVTREPMTVTVRDEGRTRVRNEYVVSAPVGGQLLRVGYKPGAHVEAGETIARILPADPEFLNVRTRAELQAAVRSAEAGLAAAEAGVERAEAELGYAESEVARAETLRSQDLTSAETLDRARLHLRTSQADLARAREEARLREAELAAAQARLVEPGAEAPAGNVVEVRSPISGRVLRVTQESAGVITSGAEIMALGDASDLEIVAEFLSTDAVQIDAGTPVLIENWSRETMPLRGRVRLVEPFGFLKVSALGVEEQRVNVIVDFVDPASEWEALGHGYRVEVAAVTWQADDIVQAPVAALFRDGEQWAVYRVVGDAARLTRVEVGHDNGRTAEILTGLEAGQTLVLYPSEQVGDGVDVVARQ